MENIKQDDDYMVINVENVYYKIPVLDHQTIDNSLLQVSIMCKEESIAYNEDLLTLIRIAVLKDSATNKYIDPYLVRSFSGILTKELESVVQKSSINSTINWCNKLIENIEVKNDGKC